VEDGQGPVCEQATAIAAADVAFVVLEDHPALQLRRGDVVPGQGQGGGDLVAQLRLLQVTQFDVRCLEQRCGRSINR
jgi:hypothetical protein